MLNKKLHTMCFCFFIILLLFSCNKSTKIDNSNTEYMSVLDRVFLFGKLEKQTFNIAYHINKKFTSSCPLKTSGTLKLSDINGENSIDLKFIDLYYIDPFIKGSYRAYFNFRIGRKDDNITFNNSWVRLRYWSNKKDRIALQYAGLDHDYDNKSINVDLLSYDGNTSPIFCCNKQEFYKYYQRIIDKDYSPFFFIPYYKNVEYNIYDPTNGLYSDGDIIWLLVKTNKGWRLGNSKVYDFTDFEKEVKKD